MTTARPWPETYGAATVPLVLTVPDDRGDHVSVDLDSSPDEAWRSCADVLFGTGTPSSATEWLRRYPGCLLVTLRTGRHCVVVVRDGTRVTVTADGRGLSADEHAGLAAALHAWLVAGLPIGALTAVITVAGRVYRVVVG